MSKVHLHKWREKVTQSFPNNRLTSRPRRKKVTKQEWVEEEATVSLRVPDTAISTPFDVPNPTNHAPSLYDDFNLFHMNTGLCMPGLIDDFAAEPLRAGDWGEGQEASGGAEWVGDASSMAASYYASAQPISCSEIGRTCGIDYGFWQCEDQSNQGVRGRGYFGEIPQVASQCSWGAPIVTSVDQFFADIQIEVFDPAPIALMLDVGDGFTWIKEPAITDYTLTGGEHTFYFAALLDYPSMYAFGYVVNVTVYDESGNVAYLETEVDGIFSGVIDFLTMIWNGLCGVFDAVANAVMAAMSFLKDLLVGMFNEIFLSPIKNFIHKSIPVLAQIIKVIVGLVTLDMDLLNEALTGLDNLINIVEQISNIVNIIFTIINVIMLFLSVISPIGLITAALGVVISATLSSVFPFGQVLSSVLENSVGIFGKVMDTDLSSISNLILPVLMLTMMLRKTDFLKTFKNILRVLTPGGKSAAIDAAKTELTAGNAITKALGRNVYNFALLLFGIGLCFGFAATIFKDNLLDYVGEATLKTFGIISVIFGVISQILALFSFVKQGMITTGQIVMQIVMFGATLFKTYKVHQIYGLW